MKTNHIKYLLTGLLFLLSNMYAQREIAVQNVTFHGVENVSQEKVGQWFGIKERDPFILSSLPQRAQSLLKGYAELGYIYSRIDSVVYFVEADSSAARIAVYVDEGVKTKLGDLNLAGLDNVTTEKLKSRFDSKRGREFDMMILERDLDDALTKLENDGYPFSRFELQTIKLGTLDNKQNSFDFSWRVIKGPQLVIKEIQIIGNKVTKDNIILREIGVRPGDIYDQRKVARISRRLLKLGYFERVDEPEAFLAEGNEGGLLLRVVEGNTSKFDGVIGYNPGTESEKGYFTGLIDISLGNLLGTGRTLLAHWQKRDRKTQDIKLYYREPWIAGFPVHLGFSFAQLIQDTTYVEREIGLDFAAPLSENLSIVGQAGRGEVSPDSLGSYTFGLLHSRTFKASLGITYDSRDDHINPRRGVYYYTAVQAGQKRNLGPVVIMNELETKKDIKNKQFLMDIEFYMPLFSRGVLAATLHGKQIRSNEQVIPITDQFRLGGARSLRGYREDQFRGNSIAWINAELRYILGRRSRAFIFIDNGYYSSEKINGKDESYKVGYGFGYRLETGLGIMGIDYGLGRGDGVFNGKVHVGLINEF